ncbi:2'-5' RNA ligase family protein [Streptomyces mauvecolor]|uniref:2'-5' RNA ligase family protein n=1 Tax=Streptomyces mauvecolor TaxID=58345 RepID=A0ABV9V005_9ACTN
MRDHWWWRPGWSVGRRFYTWHLTFDGQSDIHRFAAAYRSVLAPLSGLDLIPDQWLHLTMQGIGFVGEVDEQDVHNIAAAAEARLSGIPAFDVTLQAPVVDPEAILVAVQPDAAVRTVRNAIRAGIGDVLPQVPERAEGFTPHVSLGYSNGTGSAAPFASALAQAAVPPAQGRVTHAELIVIHRDQHMYEWEPLAKCPLG